MCCTRFAAAKDAPKEARQQARAALLENFVQEADPTAGLTDALEKELSSYEADFPDDENGSRFVTLRLRFLGEAGSAKARALLETLAKSPNRATAGGRQGAARPAHGAADPEIHGGQRPGDRPRQTARQGRAPGFLGDLVRAMHDEDARSARRS